MPIEIPKAAGINDNFPILLLILRDGIIKDHTDAAIITPDANPSKPLLTNSLISFFIMKTQAAPSIVPKKGIKTPINIFMFLNSP